MKPTTITARTNVVIEALRFATIAHGDQKRRDDITPYIEHPKRVAERLALLGMDDEVVAAALLHDVVEDTSATLEDIEARFGRRIRNYVRWLTKKRDQSKMQYITNFWNADPRACVIKLADRLDNLQSEETGEALSPDEEKRWVTAYCAQSLSLVSTVLRNPRRRKLEEFENKALAKLAAEILSVCQFHMEALS